MPRKESSTHQVFRGQPPNCKALLKGSSQQRPQRHPRHLGKPEDSQTQCCRPRTRPQKQGRFQRLQQKQTTHLQEADGAGQARHFPFHRTHIEIRSKVLLGHSQFYVAGATTAPFFRAFLFLLSLFVLCHLMPVVRLASCLPACLPCLPACLPASVFFFILVAYFLAACLRDCLLMRLLLCLLVCWCAGDAFVFCIVSGGWNSRPSETTP